MLRANSQEVVCIIEGCCSDCPPAVARALGLPDSCTSNNMPLMQCRDRVIISAPESEHQTHHLVAENKHAREVAGSNPIVFDNKYSKGCLKNK